MTFAIWVFLLFHLFPLDALQITPANAIFAMADRFASEGVILELTI